MFSKADHDAKGRRSKTPSLTNVGSVPSILSSDLTITGDLIGAGDIQIDGTITGDIKSRALTLSQSSQVEGAISATEVRMNGRFKGQVTADNVTLSKSAKVSGEIAQNSMTIEAGAEFEGSVRRLGAAKTAGTAAASAGSEPPMTTKENAAPVTPPAAP